MPKSAISQVFRNMCAEPPSKRYFVICVSKRHLKEVFWNMCLNYHLKKVFWTICASTAIAKKYFGIVPQRPSQRGILNMCLQPSQRGILEYVPQRPSQRNSLEYVPSTAISKRYFGILLFLYCNTPHCVLSLQRNRHVRNQNRKNYAYQSNPFKDM